MLRATECRPYSTSRFLIALAPLRESRAFGTKLGNKISMSTRTLKLIRFSAAVTVLFMVTASLRAQGWVRLKLNTGGNDLNTVFFLDSKRGWVGGDAGFLSHTEDGGQSWCGRTSARKPR